MLPIFKSVTYLLSLKSHKLFTFVFYVQIQIHPGHYGPHSGNNVCSKIAIIQNFIGANQMTCNRIFSLLTYIFLMSMDYQRSKYLFGNKFWVLGGLLVTLESLKSVRALSAPTQVITSFQSSGGIGLIHMNLIQRP